MRNIYPLKYNKLEREMCIKGTLFSKIQNNTTRYISKHRSIIPFQILLLLKNGILWKKDKYGNHMILSLH